MKQVGVRQAHGSHNSRGGCYHSGCGHPSEHPGKGFDHRIQQSHPLSTWSQDLNRSHVAIKGVRDVELKPEAGWGPAWKGTHISGSVQWPVVWYANFNVLPSLVRPDEAEAMKRILEQVPDDFDEDRDGVDKMITYEFIIMSAGAVKATDPHREDLRKRLWVITQPIIAERIAPFVHMRYPKAGAVCHAMIRRYLDRERRTHNTHWDIPSFVSVVVSLDAAGREFSGGFFVTTGTGL
eukprot:CAMPEP_0115517506 /NCGR_PEP_ID=MMETSP0271-20121206/77353_1 /TAXON_ID=71861 /ORGANISM="Scrippsiella trochoidea, Strain CCMP3099" /LENGTH=236 /DNA_ID=CAMNT_0002948283 /DNA_START=13 /DNA_END=721 /DNA_ORIENTATION=-